MGAGTRVAGNMVKEQLVWRCEQCGFAVTLSPDKAPPIGETHQRPEIMNYSTRNCDGEEFRLAKRERVDG